MNSNEPVLTVRGKVLVEDRTDSNSQPLLWWRADAAGCSCSLSFPLSSARGPPDISSLVPVGPKYTMKWSAPLQQVQVVEVGQEGAQNKDAFFQHGGAKRPSVSCSSGKPPQNGCWPCLTLGPLVIFPLTSSVGRAPSGAARLIYFCSQVSRRGLQMHLCCLSL